MAITILLCCYCLNLQITEGLHNISTAPLSAHTDTAPLEGDTTSISMVYLYVNDSDEQYQERRQNAAEFVKKHPASEYGTVPTPRTFSPQNDRGELKLSLRALDEFAPWIDHVFVVSDSGAVPLWMDTSSPRITVID